MLSLFQRKRVPPTAGTPPTSAIETPKGLMRPELAASLLATPRRQKLLEHIWQRTSLSRRQFATLYLAPLERYAELVQQFPASENHHHAYPGGMLDHGLEIVAYALKLRQSYLLPAGVTPEAQAAQAEAWTAGTAYAALLHDIGKIAVDLHVEHADGSVWHPWHGPLRKPYRFRYRKEREYRLHSAAAGLLYARLLDRDIFDWLSGYPDLWAALLYVLAGQYEHAGTLGELVVQADQASVAQELGGDPSKALAAPDVAATQIARRLALPAQGSVQAEPGRSGGRLADPRRSVAGEQDRLRQAARPSAVAGHRRHPGEQHGGVQRAAGSRHRATDAGWQGDLEGYRHQRRRLVARLHLPETLAGDDLGCR